MTGPSESAWFALLIAPRSLTRVEDYIQRVGYVSFMPRTKCMSKRPNRSRVRTTRRTQSAYVAVVVTAPLLPRYLFVQLPAVETPFGVFGTLQARIAGIQSFIGTGAGPLRIPDLAVERLKSREADGEFDATTRRGRRLVAKAASWMTPGAAVRIGTGPFAELDALLEELIGADRAKVSVSMFGQSTMVDTDIKHLLRV
ncbi:transcription termination/antitermination protein NusG [Lichenifustis flavocetrariae]|uniref:NusG-like N-terminal domain-containing protein n=1 Tax=Lichenifustis flavocetrariae TaxID=2949735 RepID=A0AA41Z0B4_9HYPH|nr:transcription termination/antitermination NusG family protein [Lichenifustis flavocetrariae]MCW6506972.1 hypothetical protein [Lichenifustis flavocetrariae]